MKYTKKMKLVPLQSGTGDSADGGDGTLEEDNTALTNSNNDGEKKGSGNKIRKYAADRQRKMLTIVLKLALANGYDETGMFKTMDGESMDIVPLLIYSLSPGRNITGLQDFVRLLHEANVKPQDVINFQVKEMLSKLSSSPKFTYERKKPPSPPPATSSSMRPLSPRSIPLPQTPPPHQQGSDQFQLPPVNDQVMDARTKRTIGDVDSDDDDDDERGGGKGDSKRRGGVKDREYDWSGDDSSNNI